jgi:hypothetical protein
VGYNAAGPRVIIVDVLVTISTQSGELIFIKSLPNYEWYGKGEMTVSAGSGTATLTIQVRTTSANNVPLALGTNCLLKGWIVTTAGEFLKC